MGCRWWCRVFGTSSCRLLDALSVGGRWHWVSDSAACYWGMQSQMARNRVMVGSRWPESDANRKMKRNYGFQSESEKRENNDFNRRVTRK